MRAISLAVFIVALSGCASSAEVKLRMKVAELEQERNDLLVYAVKQEQYIRQLEGGMVIQARENAHLRNGCDI